MRLATFTIVQAIHKYRVTEDDEADVTIAQCRYLAGIWQSKGRSIAESILNMRQ